MNTLFAFCFHRTWCLLHRRFSVVKYEVTEQVGVRSLGKHPGKANRISHKWRNGKHPFRKVMVCDFTN